MNKLQFINLQGYPNLLTPIPLALRWVIVKTAHEIILVLSSISYLL